MKREERQKDFEAFREQYPRFLFSDYQYILKDNGIELNFLFEIPGLCTFKPVLFVQQPKHLKFTSLQPQLLDNFAFHIGMIELISYWKTTCSPRVHIAKHALGNQQIQWWKKLYYKGLGEFFYLNSIDTSLSDFMSVTASGDVLAPMAVPTDEKRIMVPVGGGKDSAVTLEVLKTLKEYTLIPFAVNPREAVQRTIEIAGFTLQNTFVVRRSLDKTLLDLNAQGFLNGHTPFSALLAFVSVFTAALAGIKYIALSNENSANESTVPDSDINHQYSKTYEFEVDFSQYLEKYLTPDIHYFSFLRPLNELQIARLFSRFEKHHLSFRSCNVGSKTDSWCGKCPKCLFTAVILSPFMAQDKIKAVFQKDIFSDTTLKPVLNELAGMTPIKPFECVGTPREVDAALNAAFGEMNPKPPLLTAYPFRKAHSGAALSQLLHPVHEEHRVPKPMLNHLKEYLNA